MENIVVLHEYGAKSHYNALEFACNQKGVKIEYREFRFLYQFVKSLYKRDLPLFLRSISNFVFLVRSIIGLNKKCRFVIGMAPYDWRATLIYLVVYRSKYYFHTSWPFWEGDFVPHRSPSFFLYLWDKLLDGSKGVFCVTDSVRNGITEKFPELNKSKCYVVYHSIDSKFLTSARKNRVDNRSCGASKKILFIGRFDTSKGFDILLELAKNNCDKDLRISAIGDGCLKSDPRIRNIKNLGFIKDRAELARVLCENDFLFLPSRKTECWQELFGMVIIEALACGVHPIVTDHLGPNELISLTGGTLLSEENLLLEFGRCVDSISSGDFNVSKNELIEYGELFCVDIISKKWEHIFNED